MNFYDKVHELVKNLKQTPEFSNYMHIKNQVKENEELYSLIREFKTIQRQEQMKYINGKGIDEKIKEELQQKYSIIIKNPLGLEYIQSEIKLDVLLADMQKILSEGLKDAYEI